jgi:hypothetical protein
LEEQPLIATVISRASRFLIYQPPQNSSWTLDQCVKASRRRQRTNPAFATISFFYFHLAAQAFYFFIFLDNCQIQFR